ncbi:hypothetical protein GCM10023340_27400 [Nocardioides marinquilinus]|uniref:Uncharacterized protein n=1 Tax=Nocardioides marinquilinus TaxID=1210400 RepID=A0ABP9PQ61_9ACTN
MRSIPLLLAGALAGAALTATAVADVGHRAGDDPVPDGFIPKSFQPCRHEDGPGPCFWDAGERGNGRGRSYVIRHGRTYYVDGSERVDR